MVTGAMRNSYWKTANAAREAAGTYGVGTILIVPHFLAQPDLAKQPAPPDANKLLRWSTQSWKDGRPALEPAPLSSFDAIDTILERLADRRVFPNLAQVVLSGHSAGGQLMQRYAVVGSGGPKLAELGVRVRYVIANPSSYVYFSKDRPFNVGLCTNFDHWKYGMEMRPPYAAKASVAQFENAYIEREVVYLLGAEDTDPAANELDVTCMAEAQGSYRYARGRAYFDYMQSRHPGLKHRLQPVPGVAHDARKMFTSSCGLAVLFDSTDCGAQ